MNPLEGGLVTAIPFTGVVEFDFPFTLVLYFTVFAIAVGLAINVMRRS